MYTGCVVDTKVAKAQRGKDAWTFRAEAVKSFPHRPKVMQHTTQDETQLNVARFKAMFAHKVRA